MKTIIALLLASCVLSLAQTGTDNSDSASDKTQQLLSAAKSGDIKSIRLLLDNGADINATNNAGGTALIYAADRVHFSGPVHELVLGHG